MTWGGKRPAVPAGVFATRWPVVLIVVFAACAAPPSTQEPTPGVAPLIPLAAQQQPRSGELVLRSPVTLNLPSNASRELTAAVEAWSADLGRDPGLSVTVRRDLRPDAGTIRLRKAPGVANPEGYRLTVTNSAVSIEASGDGGLVYGLQTLRRLLPT